MDLPFDDEAFDTVVCQFGAMFFPVRHQAFAEVHRVLRKGGAFLFNVWDRIEDNEFADTVTTALSSLFPHDPPNFLARTPHGYFDADIIRGDLARAGFRPPLFETVTARSRTTSFRIPAIAYCHGTPLKNEIEIRGSSSLDEATEIAARAIAKRFGTSNIEGKIQAHVVMGVK